MVTAQETFGAKLTIAIHNYYPLCTFLYPARSKWTLLRFASIETCKICLPGNPYRNQCDPHDIVKWRQWRSYLMGNADDIICFSESSASLLGRVCNLVRDRISVQSHKVLVELPRKPKGGLSCPSQYWQFQVQSHLEIEDIRSSKTYLLGQKLEQFLARLFPTYFIRRHILSFFTVPFSPIQDNEIVDKPF